MDRRDQLDAGKDVDSVPAGMGRGCTCRLRGEHSYFLQIIVKENTTAPNEVTCARS